MNERAAKPLLCPPVPVRGAPSWWQTAVPAPRFAHATDNIAADVCIIGGGVTGCSTAWHLARAGVDCVLLEAGAIADGASGRNGGFLLAGLDMRPVELSASVGEDRAAALYELTASMRERLLQTAADIGVPAAARRTGSLRLATDAAELEDLQREAALLEHTTSTRLRLLHREALPATLRECGRFQGGLAFADDGASQPAHWVRTLASAAQHAGARIFESAPVRAVEAAHAPHLDSLTVSLTNAVTVRSQTVIVCTEAHLPALLPELRGVVTPYRSQVLAARIPARTESPLIPCPTWSRRGWDYAQQTQDGVCIVGGELVEDVTLYETWVESTNNVDQEYLEQWLTSVAGEAAGPPQVLRRWAGVLAKTCDRLPLVGPHPRRRGVWICGGWGGAGNVLGFGCGGLLADAVADKGSLPPEFAPARASLRLT